MTKKIGFVSLGCAKNLTDTETMLGILSRDGFEITADAGEADVIVVNTCAFIDSAKEESINAILEMAQYKEKNCELLIVTGCLAQRYREDIERELSEVDIVLGTSDYDKIAEVIADFYADGSKNSSVSDVNTNVDYDLPRVVTTPDYTAYLKIADGCDNFCTYCIIPKLRGKFRSRPAESILAEARTLAKGGAKEIILVAQDTACYGKDTGESLAALLRSLSGIDGVQWIRLQYCYPENITDELIDEIARNPKVVKYLDMPLQHVSDAVLKRMGRRSRLDEIKSLIDKIRRKIPTVAIRTSIIVGFPGESEEDFNTLKDFVAQYHLDRVGVFTYSQEEGTPAAEFDGQIADDVKQNRYDELMSVQRKVSLDNNERKIGTVCPCIAEGYDDENLCYVGRTYADTPDVDGAAYIYSDRELGAGEIVDVKILDTDEYDVTGEVQDEFTE